MKLLHAHAKYIYIVNAMYQKPSVKALVQVDFPVYAQAKALFKSEQGKMVYFRGGGGQKAVILSKNIFFWHQTSSCKCSISLYCVGKVLNCFGTSCGTIVVEFPAYALSIHMLYKIAKFIESSHFAKKYFVLHDTSSCTSQYICIVYAKY